MASVKTEAGATSLSKKSNDTVNTLDYLNRDRGPIESSGSTAGMPSAAKKYVEEQNKKSVQYLKQNGANGMPSDAMIGYGDLKAAQQGKENVPATDKKASSSSGSTKKTSNLAVGDKVQIKDGGTDVTNGAKAKKGKMYGENGPKWAKITSITENYSTGSKWGLPAKVTKVQCSDNGVVVWQVADTDIATQTIKTDKVETKAVLGKVGGVGSSKDTDDKKNKKKLSFDYDKNEKLRQDSNVGSSNGPFTPDGSSDKWYEGFDSNSAEDILAEINNAVAEEGYISDSFFDDNASYRKGEFVPISSPDKSDHQLYDDPQYEALLRQQGYYKTQAERIMRRQRKRGASPAGVGVSVMRNQYPTNWDSPGRRHELMKDDESLIQNNYGFPYKVSDARYGAGDDDKKKSKLASPKCAKYDYRIILDDPDLKKPTKRDGSDKRSFEDRLADARSILGLPVHGDPGLAKYMKMYMYNRYKVPDTNLALTKTFTYVFFTRPDLNIMDGPSNANWQSRNHTDSALIWKTHPEVFKLLTDFRRCGDLDNFNLLLSNNVLSFQLDDEKISTKKAGGSWAEHEVMYGDQYTGRTAGEFSCTFEETSNFDIMTMTKLWITYIDLVGRGAWSPYYFTKDGGITVKNRKTSWCHVYDRALDYGASVYVFVCGPDGSDILYWSKYYGVFPTSTGSSALSWNKSDPVGNVSNLNISFAYSCKKDLSPISLLEFNNASNVTEATVDKGGIRWMPGYDDKYGASTRPYVGSPYIEIDLGSPIMNGGDVDRGQSKQTKLRLKFKKPPYDPIAGSGGGLRKGDMILFRNTYKSDDEVINRETEIEQGIL